MDRDPVSLFYSYAHEDAPLREELQDHLKILERRGLLAPWHDRKIVPGAEWEKEIDANLRSAEMVLLLVSKDFMASDYIWGVELKEAMRRHDAKEATVVPIVVRAVDLHAEDAEDLPFLKLQGLPTGLRPVTSWPNRDEAWTDVAKGLRATVKTIRENRKPAPQPMAPASIAPAVPDWMPPPSAISFERPRSFTPRRVDPVLQRVVDGVVDRVQGALRARNEPPLDENGVRHVHETALSLIDMPDQKRVLWVDDMPSNNIHESGMLAKLQIEVVTARSTEEAMRRIAEDSEGFDLVISDWDRPAELRAAGLRLLHKLRAEGHWMPYLLYHAAFGADRLKRAEQAAQAGALGEAVLPSELLALVRKAIELPG